MNQNPFETAAIWLEERGVPRELFLQACLENPELRDAIEGGTPIWEALGMAGPEAAGDAGAGRARRPPIVRATRASTAPVPNFDRMSDAEFERYARRYDAKWRQSRDR